MHCYTVEIYGQMPLLLLMGSDYFYAHFWKLRSFWKYIDLSSKCPYMKGIESKIFALAQNVTFFHMCEA